MNLRVEQIRFRGILESRGKFTIEAEISLDGGGQGVGSSPVAIAPGRRERKRSYIARLGVLDENDGFARLKYDLQGTQFSSQIQFDDWLDRSTEATALGADTRLALSVAFCRATAAALGVPLLHILTAQSEVAPSMPRPLINLFSGGIHGKGEVSSFQNVMLLCEGEDIVANLEHAIRVYSSIEAEVLRKAGSVQYSASSGIIRDGVDSESLLDTAVKAIAQAQNGESRARIALDVAAEHLRRRDGRYQLGERMMDGGELLSCLTELAVKYDLGFLEDPFDGDDTDLWRCLTSDIQSRTCVVGDDLFATNSHYIRHDLATGIVLKLNQIGSLTGVFRAARIARDFGMALCVSHRSGETEDTMMCDVAVALGAAYIKIGGPRRGDRISQYNQLLRLDEQLAALAGR